MIASAPYFKMESFGAVDGPGIRLVVFLQGCPLRCVYCHNPESWTINSKLSITTEEVINKFKRNRSYYRNGGSTLSGGEPLIHQDFCLELARTCLDEGISLALDTSGANFNKGNINYFKQLIKYKPL
jgi:pyruvate formate lyase activating enzyme